MKSTEESRVTVGALAWRPAARQVFRGGSLIRVALYQALDEHVRISGDVLDLGGGPRASYRPLLKGSPRQIVSADVGDRMDADVPMDFEDVPLDRPGESCDTIIAFNLLEHIYKHAELIAETKRLLRPGGMLYVWVPFLIGYHPDPRDHYRYTDETLLRLLDETGFDDVRVRGYGGRFVASASLALSATPLRGLRLLMVLSAFTLDHLYYKVARTAIRRAVPLGYLASARRPSR
jgi:SAM-dependent methyltransferase